MAESKWHVVVTTSGNKFAYWGDGDSPAENISIGVLTPQGWMWNKVAESGYLSNESECIFHLDNVDKDTLRVLSQMWDDAPTNNGKKVIAPTWDEVKKINENRRG